MRRATDALYLTAPKRRGDLKPQTDRPLNFKTLVSELQGASEQLFPPSDFGVEIGGSPSFEEASATFPARTNSSGGRHAE